VLPAAAQRVRIEIRATDGSVLRTFANDEAPPAIGAKPYFADVWLRSNRRPGAEAGAHRFVWDLRLARPKAIKYNYSIAAVLGESTPLVPQGPLALPGNYQIALIADGMESTQPLTLKADPRVPASLAELAGTLAFSQAVSVELERDWQAHGEVEAVQRQLNERSKDSAHPPSAKLKRAMDAFDGQLESLRVDHGHEAPGLATLGDQLAALATDVEGAERLPTDAQKALLADCRGRLDRSIERWSGLRDKQLAALNAQIAADGLAPIALPTPGQLALGGDAESKDLP
jgi:hypothetical protein